MSLVDVYKYSLVTRDDKEGMTGEIIRYYLFATEQLAMLAARGERTKTIAITISRSLAELTEEQVRKLQKNGLSEFQEADLSPIQLRNTTKTKFELDAQVTTAAPPPVALPVVTQHT